MVRCMIHSKQKWISVDIWASVPTEPFKNSQGREKQREKQRRSLVWYSSPRALGFPNPHDLMMTWAGVLQASSEHFPKWKTHLSRGSLVKTAFTPYLLGESGSRQVWSQLWEFLFDFVKFNLSQAFLYPALCLLRTSENRLAIRPCLPRTISVCIHHIHHD